MIVCSGDFFDRLEKGELSVIEKRKYEVCQLAQSAVGGIPVFGIARPQGVTAPAVFVRIAKMIYRRRLSKEIECTALFELRYLARNPYDDIECEQMTEKLLDKLVSDSFDKQSVSAKRTDDGVLIETASKLRWKVIPKEGEGDLMQKLESRLTEQ